MGGGGNLASGGELGQGLTQHWGRDIPERSAGQTWGPVTGWGLLVPPQATQQSGEGMGEDTDEFRTPSQPWPATVAWTHQLSVSTRAEGD